MKRKVPRMTTDEAAEAFLEQDLLDLDFSRFKPVRFAFERKAARANTRQADGAVAPRGRRRGQEAP